MLHRPVLRVTSYSGEILSQHIVYQVIWSSDILLFNMSDKDMNAGGEDSQKLDRMVDSKIRHTLEGHNNDMLRETDSLFEKISENLILHN